MNYKLSFFTFVLFAFIFFFLYSGLNKDPTFIPSPLVGKKIPNFQSITLVDNKSISSNSLLGKFYIINVWASWCYACTLEHDDLLNITKKNTIDVYGLNYKDNKFSAIQLLKEKGNPYKENIMDYNGDIAINFGVYGVPETFLINEKGIIVHKHVGPIDESYYKTIIFPKIKK